MDKNKIKVDWNILSQYAMFTNYNDALLLQEKNRIIAEAIGTPFTSRRQNKILTKPFIITQFDTFYLYENNEIEIDENKDRFVEEHNKRYTYPSYHVYIDLKKKGYYVITGYKYGVDFLAYRDDPNFIHSEYLVVAFASESAIDTKSILSNERISVANKKKLLIAFVDMPHVTIDDKTAITNINSKMIQSKVNYIKCSWMQM